MRETIKQTDNRITVGIPESMLYFRYETLWKTFFSVLDINCITSGPTTKEILSEGIVLSVDEACLITKIFLGHVNSLIGKCDYILVPRISNFGLKRNMCTKFESLYDLTANIFRDSGQKFISYNIDVIKKIDEEDAFLTMGEELGLPKRAVMHAYKAAKKAEAEHLKAELAAQEAKFKQPGLKILICAHSYVENDAYIGRPVTKYLEKNSVVPVFADIVDRPSAIKISAKVSPTIKWEFSREIMGSIQMNADRIDGIILLSAFPCGPDSMVDDMINRKFRGIPMLNIVLDDQDGTAGLETRLESFIDILRFKGGTL